MNLTKIGFIGCGKMGGALISSIRKEFPQVTLHLFDLNEKTLNDAVLQNNAQKSDSAQQVIDTSDLIFIAVKPQVLTDLSKSIDIPKAKPLISIAAGISIDRLEKIFDHKDFVRLMPNIAASVASSVIAVTWNEAQPPEWRDDAFSLAGASGTAIFLPEKLFPAFIGISGSGIAYVLQFVHAMALGGTREGIPYNDSLKIVMDTMKGAVKLLETNDASPSSMITSVTSAGGTTIEGIYALEKSGFTSSVMKAVHESSQKAGNFE